MGDTLRDFEPSPEFSKALDLLRGRGVAMLLVGQVDDRAMQSVLRRMLGAPTEDRFRVLALLNDTDPAGYLPESITPEADDVAVLQYPRGRGAVDGQASGGSSRTRPGESAGPGGDLGPEDGAALGDDHVPGDGDLLGELDGALTGAYEQLARPPSELPDRASSGFRRGELRVVVDSLQPLLDEAGVDRVVEWLRTDPVPTLRAPRFRGRSHWVHYGPSDGPVVEALMADPGLLDLLVRVRRRGRLVEYQWVLRPDRFPHLAQRLETPWLTAGE